MSIEIRQFQDLKTLLNELEALALSDVDFVFRGHQDADWSIQSTLARHTSRAHHGWDSGIDEMLDHFIVNSRSLGELPFDVRDRRSRLEYGRHHGVPTPLIDFSWSPYVALYFAFSGIRYGFGDPAPNAAVYALDVHGLASAWAAKVGGEFMDEFRAFMYEENLNFNHGYPGDQLRFINFPASWNMRMQRQLGCFIFDTLEYRLLGWKNFEDLCKNLDEVTNQHMLTKFLVPHDQIGQVLSRLELMNITGTKLVDHEGLADDVKNAYYYNRKTGFAWDVRLPPPDDTKQ